MSDEDPDLGGSDRREEPDPRFLAELERRLTAIVTAADRSAPVFFASVGDLVPGWVASHSLWSSLWVRELNRRSHFGIGRVVAASTSCVEWASVPSTPR